MKHNDVRTPSALYRRAPLLIPVPVLGTDPIRHHTESNWLGWLKWLGYRWLSPIHLQVIGLTQLKCVDRDQRHTITLATTFSAEAGTHFTDLYGMEGRVIHQSARAGS